MHPTSSRRTPSVGRHSALRTVALAVVLSAAAALAPLSPAGAAGTFTVNWPGDTVDVNIGDGNCADINARCTLRAAVQESNANPDANTIVLPAAGILHIIPGMNEDAGATGDLDITGGPVTIEGNGAALNAWGHDRLFHVRGHALTIRDMTLRTGNPGSGPGGAILGYAGTTITLENVEVSGNKTTGFGGGLAVVGSLIIDGGLVMENRASQAGGIGVVGSLTIDGATVRDNIADKSFGGVATIGAGPVTITNATVARNVANNSAGGAYFETSFSISDSTIADNHANSALGGGLIGAAPGTVTRSTVASNTASVGGGIVAFNDLAITESAITANSAGGAAGVGLIGATSSITNTTVSGNSATSQAGGGVVNSSALALSSSTITANSAPSGAGLYTLGAGELGAPGGTSTVTNSIIANQQTGSDCAGLGPVLTGGHNLSSTTGCAFTGVGDQQGVSAGLGPLEDNGGPTLSHEPLPTSPALDTGAPACPATDQRGTIRPQGSGCDTGAIESTSATTHLSLVVSSTIDAVDAVPGDQACATAAGTCTLRAAVMEANATPGSHTITLTDGATYGLSLVGARENAGQTGDLDVTSKITFAAPGAGATVDANELERALDVHPQAIVTVDNVDLVDGRVESMGSPDDEAIGGLVRVLAGARLTLRDVRVTDGIGYDGGGIYNAGDLRVEGASSVDHNSLGGGIYNKGTALVIGPETIISDNTSYWGAGVWNEGWADFDLIGTTIARNTAEGDGGGVYNDGSMSMVQVTISENTAGENSHGGGFENSGALSIRASTISDNVVGVTDDGDGGGGNNWGLLHTDMGTVFADNHAGIDWKGKGGNISNAGTAIIIDTLITGGVSGYGGGVFTGDSTMTILRSTISNNTAAERGGGIDADGIVHIDDSTISGNTAWEGGGLAASHYVITDSTITLNTAEGGPTLGAGILQEGWPGTLGNSVVAGNLVGGDCKLTNSFTSTGYNYRGPTCTGAAGPGDVTGSAPNLGPLAANGGFTPTHLPNVGSPLIGTGNPACSGTDQRGLPRPQSGTCDKGAVDR